MDQHFVLVRHENGSWVELVCQGVILLSVGPDGGPLIYCCGPEDGEAALGALFQQIVRLKPDIPADDWELRVDRACVALGIARGKS